MAASMVASSRATARESSSLWSRLIAAFFKCSFYGAMEVKPFSDRLPVRILLHMSPFEGEEDHLGGGKVVHGRSAGRLSRPRR